MINEDSLEISDSEETLFIEKSEFEDVSILYVTVTENCNYMLLKNGTILSWSDSYDALGRKCTKTAQDKFNLLPVTFDPKVKILNISCGNKHCIAKTINMHIYSWGNNQLGQLGLGKLFKTPEDRKKYKLLKLKQIKLVESNTQISPDDKKRFNYEYYSKNYEQFIEEVSLPTFVKCFKGIKIKEILADGNNSYVVTENANNLFVWGCNKFNKFDLPYLQKRIIFKPYLLHEGCNSNNEIYLDMNYLKNTFNVWEISIPNNEVSKALLCMENKLIENKISELRNEYKYIKEYSDFTAYRLKFDKYDLIDRIKKLKYFYIQKYKEEQKNFFGEILTEFNNLYEYFIEKLKYILETYNEKVFTFDLDKEKEKIDEYVDKVYNKNFNKESKDLKTNFKIEETKSMNGIQILEAVEVIFRKVNIYEKIFEEKINFDNIERDLVQKSQEMLSKIEAFHFNDQENKYFYNTFINQNLNYIDELFSISPQNKVVKDVRVINSKIEEINERINRCHLNSSLKPVNTNLSVKVLIKNILNELDLVEDELKTTIFDNSNEIGIISKKILRNNILYIRQNNLLMNKLLIISDHLYDMNADTSREDFVDRNNLNKHERKLHHLINNNFIY